MVSAENWQRAKRQCERRGTRLKPSTLLTQMIEHMLSEEDRRWARYEAMMAERDGEDE